MRLIFVFCYLPLLGMDTPNLEQWPTPVLFAGKIVLNHERLYVEDRFDNKIKTYDVSHGLEKPKFLWATRGEGDGPGEKPKGSRVNQITVDSEDGMVWISHSYGYLGYKPDGTFVAAKKVPFNHSWLVMAQPLVCNTSPELLRDRYIMTMTDRGTGNMLWQIESQQGIPMNREGRIIGGAPELYYQDKHYFSYQATSGELVMADSQGVLQLHLFVPQTLHPDLVVDTFDESFRYNRKQTLSVTHLPYPHVGLIKLGNSLFFPVIHHGKAVLTGQDSKRKHVHREAYPSFYL